MSTTWRARADEAAGVDVIIARDGEGGGHSRNDVSTLALLARVLDVVEVLVLAAGAVMSARGLAAVFACGASGSWISTTFLLCPVALTDPLTYERIIAATETDTIYTRYVDVALGYPWPAQFGERVLRNRFTDPWADDAESLASDETVRADFVRAPRAVPTRPRSTRDQGWDYSRAHRVPHWSLMTSPAALGPCLSAGLVWATTLDKKFNRMYLFRCTLEI